MRIAPLVLIGLLLVLPSCGGSSTHSVSGTVNFDGQPLPDGNIAFSPTGTGARGPGKGAKITGGKYELRTEAGKYKVQITASKMMPLPKGEVGMYGEKEMERQYIPDRYNAKTELTADVPGSGPINFDLKSN
jgi:hypothetical protein